MRILILALLFLLACRAQPAVVQSTPAPTLPPAPTANVVAPTASQAAFLNFDADLHLIDLTTGKDAPDFSLIRKSGIATFSDDGKTIALVENGAELCRSKNGGMSCRLSAVNLRLLEPQTQHQTKMPFPSGGWVDAAPVFSHDGTKIAVSYQNGDTTTIMLVNVQTATLIKQRVVPYTPSLMNFTQDNQSLMLYAPAAMDGESTIPPSAPQLLLLDSTTLQNEWDQTLTDVVSGVWCVSKCDGSYETRVGQVWSPAVVLSRDGNRLYILHADADKLTTVDLTAHTVQTNNVETARGAFENFLAFFANTAYAKGEANGAYKSAVLSADGASLYAISQKIMNQTYSLGALQQIDLATGRVKSQYTITNNSKLDEYVNELNLTPDGSHLYITRSESSNHWETDFFDANTLQLTSTLDGWRTFRAHTRAGQQLLLAQIPNLSPIQLAIVDPATFQVSQPLILAAHEPWLEP